MGRFQYCALKWGVNVEMKKIHIKRGGSDLQFFKTIFMIKNLDAQNI